MCRHRTHYTCGATLLEPRPGRCQCDNRAHPSDDIEADRPCGRCEDCISRGIIYKTETLLKKEKAGEKERLAAEAKEQARVEREWSEKAEKVLKERQARERSQREEAERETRDWEEWKVKGCSKEVDSWGENRGESDMEEGDVVFNGGRVEEDTDARPEECCARRVGKSRCCDAGEIVEGKSEDAGVSDENKEDVDNAATCAEEWNEDGTHAGFGGDA